MYQWITLFQSNTWVLGRKNAVIWRHLLSWKKAMVCGAQHWTTQLWTWWKQNITSLKAPFSKLSSAFKGMNRLNAEKEGFLRTQLQLNEGRSKKVKNDREDKTLRKACWSNRSPWVHQLTEPLQIWCLFEAVFCSERVCLLAFHSLDAVPSPFESRNTFSSAFKVCIQIKFLKPETIRLKAATPLFLPSIFAFKLLANPEVPLIKLRFNYLPLPSNTRMDGTKVAVRFPRDQILICILIEGALAFAGESYMQIFEGKGWKQQKVTSLWFMEKACCWGKNLPRWNEICLLLSISNLKADSEIGNWGATAFKRIIFGIKCFSFRVGFEGKSWKQQRRGICFQGVQLSKGLGSAWSEWKTKRQDPADGTAASAATCSQSLCKNGACLFGRCFEGINLYWLR